MVYVPLKSSKAVLAWLAATDSLKQELKFDRFYTGLDNCVISARISVTLIRSTARAVLRSLLYMDL
jgi:hypothetical protein